MNHNEWVRLRKEGDKIVTALATIGYQVFKVKGVLSWKISAPKRHNSEASSYTLTWLPAPVGEWTLLPKDFTAERDRMIQIIESSLSPTPSLYRGTGRSKQEHPRPWVISQLLPNATNGTIARFFNRQDACDHLRFLTRTMPAAKFTMFFDPPDC
ncbi:MAG TPA: hypothetical protein V6D30_02105 [Leptolyngbyaceae cyanobacterium]